MTSHSPQQAQSHFCSMGPGVRFFAFAPQKERSPEEERQQGVVHLGGIRLRACGPGSVVEGPEAIQGVGGFITLPW